MGGLEGDVGKDTNQTRKESVCECAGGVWWGGRGGWGPTPTSYRCYPLIIIVIKEKGIE